MSPREVWQAAFAAETAIRKALGQAEKSGASQETLDALGQAVAKAREATRLALLAIPSPGGDPHWRGKRENTAESSTAVAQPVADRYTSQYVRVPSSTTSTGVSVLSSGSTVVVRAIRGQSISVPYNAEREAARRENLQANRPDSQQKPFTGNKR